MGHGTASPPDRQTRTPARHARYRPFASTRTPNPRTSSQAHARYRVTASHTGPRYRDASSRITRVITRATPRARATKLDARSKRAENAGNARAYCHPCATCSQTKTDYVVRRNAKQRNELQPRACCHDARHPATEHVMTRACTRRARPHARLRITRDETAGGTVREHACDTYHERASYSLRMPDRRKC